MHRLTIQNFGFARMPEVCFGPGVRKQLPQRVKTSGRVLLVTGSHSFLASEAYAALTQSLAQA